MHPYLPSIYLVNVSIGGTTMCRVTLVPPCSRPAMMMCIFVRSDDDDDDDDVQPRCAK